MFVLAISSPSMSLIRPLKRNGPNRSPVRIILCMSQRRQSKTSTGKSWIVPVSLSLFGSGFVLGPLLDGLHSRVDLVVYQNGAFQIGPLHTNIWVPFLLGLFYCTVGLLQLLLDERTTSIKPPRGNMDKTVISFLALVVFLELSAEMYRAGVSDNIEAYILFALAEFLWFSLDRTWFGFTIATLLGIACPFGHSSSQQTMVFVKSSKSNAYFKRYQVKFRRRRDGKTDYRARIRLINQDKNKYNTPKYRFVVRFTNKDIVAQIVSASIAGDIVKASAYAHELPHYGLTVGLTNYAAAYCTGLLLARRVLKMLEMDDEYEGNVEATGEDFSVEPTDSRRPFRALLDVGLIRTTTGNRVFGALKGALDGGLDIPHSDKRFAGFNKENKQLDAEIHRNYIYGGHVSNYMKLLAEDEPEKLQTHFSAYIKKGVEAESIAELYKKVHAAIRADPNPKKTEKPAPKEHKRYNLKKLTYEERKNKLIERVKALNGAGGDDDDEDDEE